MRHINDEHERLRTQLLRAVRAKCPGWLQDRAEDITQKAMMTLLRILETREADRPVPASYLRKVAFTTMIDEIRRLRKERHDRSIDEPPSDLQLQASNPSPERNAQGRQTMTLVQECVGRLPEARRGAVLLYLLEEPVPDIARRRGWDRKRTSNLVYRGLAAVRRCLEANGIRP